jgi:hypothetical protein
MNKSTWLMLLAAVACVGCCAIPVYGLIVSASGLGLFVVALLGENKEIIACLLPLAMLLIIYGSYKLLRAKPQKVCCEVPEDECVSNNCALPPKH